MNNTKQKILGLIEELVEEKVLNSFDFERYVKGAVDSNDPSYITHEMEEWYKDMGLEYITGKRLSLSECPFTREEIEETQKNGETILCVPKGISREDLGKLFRIDSWALHDQVVTRAPETEDCWFRTSMSLIPRHIRTTGVENAHRAEDENKLNFSLERYLVFIGRVRYLTGKNPDSQYWIWLPRGRYDRSGMLIAGFDRTGSFNVHGWMPQFSSGFVGARFGIPHRDNK
ncbi:MULTISPECIES: hypothetical protein [Clostridium]|uniref:hypothetical protein n=1 Tax=Clostridium TaxID=1485 RepID=UPI00082458D1|nr:MULTISPECIES: hypothetical protein [Clostridium]PJI06506.1 hypothetical protein CUB90_00880 [Clostridium sp. CT7]